ncbi:MAG TPA: glucose 1-dehydrogenase [Acidimicrobiales bacterium]|nr:glucose 1-dehydrogenase [Acidimicrobiales bacterium]
MSPARGLLDDRVVLVTGASAGIGRAGALCFAREGAAAVVVADVDDEGGAETVRLLADAGCKGVFVHCDVAEDAMVAAAVAAAVDGFGRLDAAYNNAGLGHGQAPTAEIDRAGWDRTLDVNLTGTMLCMQHELRHMAPRGAGAIVNQSSAAGLVGWPLLGGYGATKAAIAHLTKVAAVEYATQGIRINAIAPGPIATDMVARAIAASPAVEEHINGSVPMARLGQPDEVAQTAAWLLSDRASFITGVTVPVDGGQTSKG